MNLILNHGSMNGKTSRRKRIHNPQRELNFNKMLTYLKSSIAQFPDPIKRNNRTYTITDIGLSAFSTFYTQCPSFLAQQKLIQQKKGNSNAQTLFLLKNIASTTHIKEILDFISAENLYPVFDNILYDLDESGRLEEFEFLDGQLLFAFDGTQFFSSNKIHCDNCSTKQHKNGDLTYYHLALTPVIVKPGHNKVISLPPEFIVPQDGKKKQDCEINAMERWLNKHADKYSDKKITVLGDDLYAKQPNIQRILDQKWNYIYTCKEKSHKYLYECLSLVESGKGTRKKTEIKFHGKNKKTYTYRFLNNLPLRKKDFISTNWCELVITDEKGKVTFSTACITNFEITEENVVDIIRAHRSRWKIENENNNVLKTKGYYLEHNFGHGKKNLTSMLITMNLLAFLFHTVLDIVDIPYQILRKTFGRRIDFFNNLRALLLFHLFDSWKDLLKFMFDGLELDYPPD